MWTVLRHPAFRRLWLAATVDSLGTWLLVTAVPVEVFARTGSAVSTGLALAVEAGPALLLGPWAGVLVDRRPGRRLLVGADLTAAAGVALMLLPTGIPLYAGLAVESVAVCFLAPAVQALVPAVAPDLAAANAALAVSRSTWRILGPLAGAAVTAAGRFPLVAAADALSYLAAAAVIAGAPGLDLPGADPSGLDPAGIDPAGIDPAGIEPPGAGGPAGNLVALRAGLRLVAGTPVLRALLVGSCLYWTANAALTALLVPLATERLRAGAAAVGYLVTALGVGYLAGAAVARRLLRLGPWAIAAGYGAVGACFLVLVTTGSLPVALAAVAAGGVPGAVAVTATGQHLQVAAPQALIGRVVAAFRTSDALAAIAGALAAPALVALAGLRAALIGSAAVVPVAAVLTTLLLPRGTRPRFAAAPGRAGPR